MANTMATAKGKMTNPEAKEILKLYRPNSADAADPAFTEALALCESDAELKSWFENHCALYAALRAKFRQIAVPEGLKEQIVAERRVHTTPLWQRAVLIAGGIAVALMVAFQIQQHWRPSEPVDFAAYCNFMESVALRGYAMDNNSTNLDQIRLFLSQKQTIADYVIPPDLEKNAKPVGCVATSWQGKNISMICFQSGRPLPAGQQSDLWLFISDETIAKDSPRKSTPIYKTENGVASASWTVGNRTYVLAAQGDQQFLSKFVDGKTVL